MNEKEILNALKLIKKICETAGSSCKNCPFYVPSICRCTIHEVWPEDWEIIDEAPSFIWRAFKN